MELLQRGIPFVPWVLAELEQHPARPTEGEPNAGSLGNKSAEILEFVKVHL